MFISIKDFLTVLLGKVGVDRTTLVPRAKVLVDALCGDIYKHPSYAELRFPFGKKEGQLVLPPNIKDADYGYMMGLGSWHLSSKQMEEQKDLWYVIHVLACRGYMNQHKDWVPGYTLPLDKLLEYSFESSSLEDVLKFEDRVYAMIAEHSKGKFTFGKYDGISIERVFLMDPRYVNWVIENLERLPQEQVRHMLSMKYANSIFV